VFWLLTGNCPVPYEVLTAERNAALAVAKENTSSAPTRRTADSRAEQLCSARTTYVKIPMQTPEYRAAAQFYVESTALL
jgi:hypothetical protein